MTGRKYFFNACKGFFSEIPEEGRHQHVCNEVSGHLVHIEFKNTSIGEVMRLHVVNETNFYILSFLVANRIATTFFLLVKSLNLRDEMKFRIWRDGAKDYFQVHQYGASLRWYYTQENADELPKGQDERTKFLRNMVADEIIPVLQKKENPFPHHTIYKPKGSGRGLHGGYFDDHAGPARRVAPISENEAKSAGFDSVEGYRNHAAKQLIPRKKS